MFTLEMSKAEVTQRLMCSEAKVESQRLRTGKLAPDDWPRLTAACDKLAKAPIYVDDTGSINMMEIRSKARRLKSRNPDLGLLVVDYLQLMSSAGNPENRVQEVSLISRSLKILARDLDVPILALSQLSRAVEQRTDKRPILSDLRESGCLAGDTRVYLPDEGVYRPIRDLEGRSGLPRARARHRNVASRGAPRDPRLLDGAEAGVPASDPAGPRDSSNGQSQVPRLRRLAPARRSRAGDAAGGPAHARRSRRRRR